MPTSHHFLRQGSRDMYRATLRQRDAGWSALHGGVAFYDAA
jgi:hypothetical protein